MARAEARYDSETGRVILRIDAWDDAFPAEDLDRWIAFYQRQRENHPKAGTSYDETIAVLEALRPQLPATGPAETSS